MPFANLFLAPEYVKPSSDALRAARSRGSQRGCCEVLVAMYMQLNPALSENL
jgi:hypothetical protein